MHDIRTDLAAPLNFLFSGVRFILLGFLALKTTLLDNLVLIPEDWGGTTIGGIKGGRNSTPPSAGRLSPQNEHADPSHDNSIPDLGGLA